MVRSLKAIAATAAVAIPLTLVAGPDVQATAATGPSAPYPPKRTAVMKFHPGHKTVQVGSTFTVRVRIKTGPHWTNAVQFYTTSGLECQSISFDPIWFEAAEQCDQQVAALAVGTATEEVGSLPIGDIEFLATQVGTYTVDCVPTYCHVVDSKDGSDVLKKSQASTITVTE